MEKSELKKIEHRLMGAKLGLLNAFPFYALLLSHTRFVADKNCKSITCYNNDIIYLPEFVDKLQNDELQFVLMHLVLHLALGHPFRKQENYDTELFDLACDIVVNSNIIDSISSYCDFFKNLIVSNNYGHYDIISKFPNIKNIQHLTPDNREGYHFTADEVYKMLQAAKESQQNLSSSLDMKSNTKANTDNSSENDSDESGATTSDKEDKSTAKEKQDDKDSKETKKQKSKGKDKGKEEASYNPDEDEELQELLKSLRDDIEERRESIKKSQNEQPQESDDNDDPNFDDHTYWQGESENELMPISEKWTQRCLDIADITDAGGIGCFGKFPAGVKRKLKDFMEPKLDWRQVLNEFVQEEICDYSFSPPDKRMEDCPFFLPDFNETEAVVKKILFAIDCSGSMSNKEVTQCYSEIYHAILQFNGKLEGYVGFFDSAFYTPTPFEDIGSFAMAEPTGGGGTCVEPIFEYVNQEMCDDPPVSIIVLTDGYVNYPDESVANNIPVLWILTKKSKPPTWGKTISIADQNNDNF